MSAVYPLPTWDKFASTWRLDLRTPWRLGRHILRLPPPPEGYPGAIHAARDLWESLRAAAAAADPQRDLPGIDGPTLAVAIEQWLAVKRWKSDGGERWTREVSALLVRELGRQPLVAIEPGLLWRYRDDLRAGRYSKGRPLSPKSAESRLTVLGQILRWSAEPPRRWIDFAPPMPSPKLSPSEAMRVPLTKWVDEATFRAARAGLYGHPTAHNGLCIELRARGLAHDAAAVRDWVEKRRLYLSFAFYTGMRRHDLDEITDAYLSPDLGCYFRHGRKTSIAVSAESICEPFAADIEAELRRLGRSAFRPGELVAGGPWKNVARVLSAAAARVGVESFNLRDCRRSFVYHKALAGVAMPDLVNLMGHVDSQMIRAVYLRLQPRLQRNLAGAAWPRSVSAVPGTGDARVLPFVR